MTMISTFLTVLAAVSPAFASDWRTATRDSAGIAPDPMVVKEAVVQVYTARTVGWKGYFAVHPWIAVKAKNATEYVTFQVIGWRAYRGYDAVVVQNDIPDRHWFGAKPELLEELRGEAAERAIPQIENLAKNYAYRDFYRVYPGPNSNTFVSHIIRNVPELKVELPPIAIGKDWINKGDLVGWSESKTGFQISLLGMLGLTLGLSEGIEINILGLNFGIDFLSPALKLPIVGRLGVTDK